MEKQEALNLNSGVSVIQRVLLSTPPQNGLTSLPRIHVTLKNLFIFSLRGYCYQIWAVKQLLNRSPQGTFPMRVVTSLPFDNVTVINLYISSYRKATGATIISKWQFQVVISNFKYFAIINFARETNALLVGDLVTGLLYLYMKQAN